GAGAGDDRRAVADRVHRGGEQLEPFLVGERRRLAGGARDDETVRAVVDEEGGELAELVEVDRAVLVERRHDGGQDLAEHPVESTPPGRESLLGRYAAARRSSSSRSAKKIASENVGYGWIVSTRTST